MAEGRVPAIVVGTVVVAALAFVAVGIFVEGSLPGRLLTGSEFRTAPRQPTCGQATVDGDVAEWILADDAFADLYGTDQEDENAEAEAKLYLRYDCRTNLMYALVLSAGDRPMLLRRSQARLALDSAGDEAALVDFSWVGPGYDGHGEHARGWEASFPAIEGVHLLWAAAPIQNAGEVQEVSTPQDGMMLALECDEPTTMFLSRLEAVPTSGRIRLEWETAWEVNNLGFNIYHSSSREGPWTRVNPRLIPSKPAVEGGDGAEYEFVHIGVDLAAENYYLLEDLGADGMATRHGPVAP